MPNIINPNCPSLPQQVQKNTEDIFKLFSSKLEELSGLEFNPISLIYQQDKAIISGKFIVTRDELSTEINGVVTIPIKGENGVVVDASEDNLKIRIALDQTDRELFNFVQELVNRTTDSDEIVFTSDMENFVNDAIDNCDKTEVVYDAYDENIEINKGFTAGIIGGVEVNIDLNKYKFLRIFCRPYTFDLTNNGGTNNCFIVDLTRPLYVNTVISKNVFSYSNLEYAYKQYFDVYFAYNKTNHNFVFGFTFDGELRNNNNACYVYKIEGVFN